MPIYEYTCPTGHKTDHLVSFDRRTLTIACGTCGGEASLGIALPAIGTVKGSNTPVRASSVRAAGFKQTEAGVWEKGSSIDADKIVDWRCTACPKKDVAVDEPFPAACPSCGAAVEAYHNENAQWRDWFPQNGYFDRGLGVFFNTRKERSDYAKAHGLTEAAGIYEDTERAVYESKARDREMDEFWTEECRMAAAAGDRDAVPQWIKTEIGWVD